MGTPTSIITYVSLISATCLHTPPVPLPQARPRTVPKAAAKAPAATPAAPAPEPEAKDTPVEAQRMKSTKVTTEKLVVSNGRFQIHEVGLKLDHFHDFHQS